MGSAQQTLVLLDGVGCDGFIWKYLIPHFANRYRIIHFHYRGHGLSGLPDSLDKFGVEELADDCLAVLDHAKVTGTVNLLGHSMGVQVILEFAHRYKKRVNALVAITGSYGKAVDHIHDSDAFRKIFPAVRLVLDKLDPQRDKASLFVHLFDVDTVIRSLWKQMLSSRLAYKYVCAFEINQALINQEDFMPYLDHLSKMDPVVFFRSLAGAARHTAEPYLADIDVPTLIVAGEADRFTPYWISRRMHAMIPRSEMLSLPMGSHAGPLELPELTNLRIEKFLAGLDP
jgi:pimeloyl-ACP methyl ester carboxylesterase